MDGQCSQALVQQTIFDLPGTLKTDAGACYVLRLAVWIGSVFIPNPSGHRTVEPSRPTALESVSIASAECACLT